MPEITTDCRSEEGVTVGLIDAVVSVCRVLSGRPLRYASEAVKQALLDLRSDPDVAIVMGVNRASDTPVVDHPLLAPTEVVAVPYGYCPTCGLRGVFRMITADLNGMTESRDSCSRGHTYLSVRAVYDPMF